MKKVTLIFSLFLILLFSTSLLAENNVNPIMEESIKIQSDIWQWRINELVEELDNSSGSNLTNKDLVKLKSLKRTLYGMMYLQGGLNVFLGKENPFISFKVEGNPSSVFYNFKIKEEKLGELAMAIPLPEGFSLAPVSILEGDDDAHYYISLNVYLVSGLVSGLRAEWSVYVKKGEDDTPRFMIIEARSSTDSLDPVDLWTKASHLEHIQENNQIETIVESDGYTQFHAIFSVPEEDKTYVYGTREWITANDYIYWINGINDRAFYNGSLFNVRMVSIPSNSVQINDSTKWAEYIEPVPVSTFIFEDSFEFIVSPWWNLEDMQGE